MSTILVTGAAGFIGSHLVPKLKDAGHEVLLLDIEYMKDTAKGIPFDIRASETLPWLEQEIGGQSIDACIHLAAIASPNKCKDDPTLAWSTNVHGTHNVLALCKRLNIRRFIFFSSAHVYGISPRYMPTDENHPLALLDTYTSTKIVGENLCDLFYRNHGISYTILRLFNAYGPGQSADYFMGRKLAEAKAGGPVVMRTKLAKVTKDWIYISDVVDAAIRAIQTEYVGPLNIGTGIETPLEIIAQEIATQFNLPLLPEDTDDPGPTRMCCDNKRARSTLGWEPKISFSTGLQSVISEVR